MAYQWDRENVYFCIRKLPSTAVSLGQSFSVELQLRYPHPILPEQRCAVVCAGALDWQGNCGVYLDGPCEVRCSSDGIFIFDGLKFPPVWYLTNKTWVIRFGLKAPNGMLAEEMFIPIHLLNDSMYSKPTIEQGNVDLQADAMEDVELEADQMQGVVVKC
ncbi:hypothetical protein LIA77_06067 [Sarocladium implicatum]|nr:hypothetical protein LIA77_06067 [Sarocladium implicatum]